MKRSAITAVLALAFTNPGLYGQTPNPLSFFPHHLGDIWEYYYPQDTTVIEQNIITSDSLGSDGKYYLQTTLFGSILVDTTNMEVYSNIWGGTQYGNLTYRLAADSGDEWTVYRNGLLVLRARVTDEYQTYVFGGNLVTVKEIDYSDSSSGLLFNTDYLASNFGLIGDDFDTFPARRIRGTRINGVQHGTITSVENDWPLQAQSFHLHQNFPNPFNPTTTLRYELSRGGSAELKIFNITGEEVRTLVNEIQPVGTYEILFDAQGLASGTYFCTLKTPNGLVSKKMILLR